MWVWWTVRGPNPWPLISHITEFWSWKHILTPLWFLSLNPRVTLLSLCLVFSFVKWIWLQLPLQKRVMTGMELNAHVLQMLQGRSWVLSSTWPEALLLLRMEIGKNIGRSQGCCSVRTPTKLAPSLSIMSTPGNNLPRNREDLLVMEKRRGNGWWEELAKGSIAGLGRHSFSPFLHQSVSTCVSSHMPRQQVQICLVTRSILCCPINNRHNLSCQEQLIRGWSLCLDPRSWNTNPIKWKLNELWTQFPPPALLLRGACMNTQMGPARTQSSFCEASGMVSDWAPAISQLFARPQTL